MKTRWLGVSFLMLGLALLATGCAEEDHTGTPTTSEFLKERKALAARPAVKPTTAAANTAVVEGSAGVDETGYASAERDYFYDPRGKRDPFRSFRFADSDDDGTGESFGPLGDFELAQLELSAVIWDATNPRALILDPGGRAYIVHEGSQIGKNSGQVIHIGDNLVLVKETYENLAGEQTTKDVELRIRLSQGG
jgi:type IV pilus assembly protein PilP